MYRGIPSLCFLRRAGNQGNKAGRERVRLALAAAWLGRSGVGRRGLAVQYCDKVLWDCLTNAAVPLGVPAVTDEALAVTDA